MAENERASVVEQPKEERIHGASEIEDAIMKAIDSSAKSPNHKMSEGNRSSAKD